MSVLSLLRLLTAVLLCAVLCGGAVAAGARRLPLSIDISCPRGAQQQTHHTLLHRSIHWVK